MNIIAHRGYWREPSEKNTRQAFERSFANGLGVETDLRDNVAEIVVSHCMPVGGEMLLQDFLAIADQYAIDKRLTIAFNIKADGLYSDIVSAVKDYPSLDCFVFDMAVPDMRWYLGAGIPVYTRLSDIETIPVYESQAQGIWLDSFCDPVWYDHEKLSSLLAKQKICVVSPELHGFDPLPVWRIVRALDSTKNLILCTDCPGRARQFFEE
jgi:hypothetical protein